MWRQTGGPFYVLCAGTQLSCVLCAGTQRFKAGPAGKGSRGWRWVGGCKGAGRRGSGCPRQFDMAAGADGAGKGGARERRADTKESRERRHKGDNQRAGRGLLVCVCVFVMGEQRVIGG